MSYRDLASRQALAWAVVAVGARMPVAMAPLALVFLVRERPGGYTLGAALAAAYVIGEIVAAPVLGTRMRPHRARRQLALGLSAGALGFTGLGAFPHAHPAVLAACAALAGAAPAAAPGGLRALLTGLVPKRAVAQALSAESMLTFGIWSLTPAVVTGLALEAAPRVPLLLAAALMAASVPGLWTLPAGWDADETDRAGESMPRILARAWPAYVMGAAGLSLLALAELVLPALLEQRGAGVGWAGPLLTGLSLGAAVGAFLYGLRSWPGRLSTRSTVLTCGMAACLALVALIPDLAWMACALVFAGVLQAGAMLTRNLSLREMLPPSALAAGYSVMYAAVGAGYAATGSLAGALLPFVAPSTAILAGVGLTLLLTLVGAWGERDRTASAGDLSAGADPGAAGRGAAGPGATDPGATGRGAGGRGGSGREVREGAVRDAAVPGPEVREGVAGIPVQPAARDLPAGGAEGTAVRGGGDPEHRL
ncbi:MFS transporter [Streptomyces fagopyri]|uniref:MFS transporter n=1 Tax=Streptomyces fagopyri TaxID=2662397 RepID=UPI0036BE7DE0